MDELCLYLKNKYPDNFICGYEDCNMLLWGIKGSGDSEIKCCTLVAGIDYDPLNINREQAAAVLNGRYKNDKAFKNLFWHGKRMSGNSNWPFLVIAYPSMRREYNHAWEQSEDTYPPYKVQFYYKNVSRDTSGVLDGAQLKEYLYEVMGVNFTDSGTTKEKNKSLADYFHFWSRSVLSGKITKFDPDGFLTDRDNKAVLIEIKRSGKPPIPKWRPHPKDRVDYVLQNKFARAVGAGFWVLHHEPCKTCTGDTPISFFDVKGVNLDWEKEKKGVLICKEQVIPLLLEGEDSLETRINKTLEQER